MHRMGIETIATGTGGFVDTIFTSGPNRNGYLFERLSDWKSPAQDSAIKAVVHQAVWRNKAKLNTLYASNAKLLAPFIAEKRTIMSNAAKSTWTSTFNGSLSPIERIKLAYAAALRNKGKRGIAYLDIHALKL
jgi:hypothetical protein